VQCTRQKPVSKGSDPSAHARSASGERPPPESASRSIRLPIGDRAASRLKIGRHDDAAEAEADRLADRVLGQDSDGQAPALRPPSVHALRVAPTEATTGTDTHSSLSSVHEVLRRPGAPLRGDIRADMEARFGQDFSRVRVHNDTSAAASARSLNALAYSVSDHLVFGHQQYAPESLHGRRLLAHELAHTMQSNERGVLTVRRQVSVAATSPRLAGPSDDVDPVRGYEFPGFGYWLLQTGFSQPPSVQQARDAVASLHPQLMRSLYGGTARVMDAPGARGRQVTFRDGNGHVVARTLLTDTLQYPAPRGPVYGIYIFVPDSEGLAVADRARGQGSQAQGSQQGLQPGQREEPTRQRGEQAPATGQQPDALLALYFRSFPPQAGGRPTASVDSAMKLRLALSLADRSFFGSVYDAAMDAITNPMFLVQTVLMVGIYVGLWLTPDPTFITKLAASALTAFLLTMFAWNDIIGFGRAWFQLSEDSAAATTEAGLRQAGNAFMRTLGQVGFDVFLMVLMWGMGRAARGRLTAARNNIAARNVTEAQGRVTAAEAQPGSGGRAPMAQEEHTALAEARGAAGAGATPTQVLDELATRLPEGARAGFAAERASGGAAQDARVLRVLEGRAQGNASIFRYLQERGMSDSARQTARQGLIDARARLARARLVQLRSLENFPSGNQSVASDIRNVVGDFARALQRLSPRFQSLLRARAVDAVIGDLGEALARGQLQQTLQPGQQVVSSLELAEPVPGFRTVAEWAAAERAAGRDPVATGSLGRMRQGPRGIYRSVGQIDNAVVRQTQSGTLQFDSIEETKTGTETGQGAAAQVQAARTTLQSIYDGSGTARVMERLDSTTVGADLTSRYSASSQMGATTRGPAGRQGFDADLGVSREDLAAVARQIIAEGIPPGEPGMARQVPPSGDRSRHDDRPPTARPDVVVP